MTVNVFTQKGPQHVYAIARQSSGHFAEQQHCKKNTLFQCINWSASRFFSSFSYRVRYLKHLEKSLTVGEELRLSGQLLEERTILCLAAKSGKGGDRVHREIGCVFERCVTQQICYESPVEVQCTYQCREGAMPEKGPF